MPDGVHVVTGAASGIGLEVARSLHRQGQCFVACDIDLARLTALAATEGWQATPRAFDVRDAAAWEDLVATVEAELGPVSVLYNIAGYLRPGWVHELEAVEVDRHFDINVKGVVHGTQAAVRRMRQRGGGHVINLASMAALAPIHGLSLYSASKYAVRAFSLAAAYELRPHGVAVTAVCPDAVATPMLDLQKDYREAAMTFSAPRILTATEVAAVLTGPVLRRRPLEVMLPPSRGWLAKLANLLPGLNRLVGPLVERQGRLQQRRHPPGTAAPK